MNQYERIRLSGFDDYIYIAIFLLLVSKKRVNGEITNFVKLFDGKREVDQIIDDSGLDDLVVLKRIVRLYHQGLLSGGGRRLRLAVIRG